METRSPIVIEKSGATVVRVSRDDGTQWIQKSARATEVSVEAAVMAWCAGRLPVADLIAIEGDVLSMSMLPDINLTEAIGVGPGSHCGSAPPNSDVAHARLPVQGRLVYTATASGVSRRTGFSRRARLR
jgi:hypothetical protein